MLTIMAIAHRAAQAIKVCSSSRAGVRETRSSWRAAKSAGGVCTPVAGGADAISGLFRFSLWNQTIPDHLRGRLAGVEMISWSSGPLLGDAEAAELEQLIDGRRHHPAGLGVAHVALELHVALVARPAAGVQHTRRHVCDLIPKL